MRSPTNSENITTKIQCSKRVLLQTENQPTSSEPIENKRKRVPSQRARREKERQEQASSNSFPSENQPTASEPMENIRQCSKRVPSQAFIDAQRARREKERQKQLMKKQESWNIISNF